MNFEEEFPSLTNTRFRNKNMGEDYFDGNKPYKGNFYKYWHSQEDIQNHCLDKQKVKEAIQRVCLQTGAEVTEGQLLIDLGLEDWRFRITEVEEMVKKYNWDNSDCRTDYFDVNYYFFLNLGRYGKPFIDGK